MAVIFGAFSVGQASSFAPDFAEAKISSARIFKLLDREPVIDNYADEGSDLVCTCYNVICDSTKLLKIFKIHQY